MENEAKNYPNESDPFMRDFKALPLDEKFTHLFRMEAAALGEAVTMIVNEPMKVVEKVGDMISDFGTRIEAEARKATGRPSSDEKPKPGERKAGNQRGKRGQ